MLFSRSLAVAFCVAALGAKSDAQVLDPGLSEALFGFTCQTELGEDSGLYAIEVGFVLRTGERIAELILISDGKVRCAASERLLTQANDQETVFSSSGGDVYIKASNKPEVDGTYRGVAKVSLISGLEYPVSCRKQTLN